MKIKLALLILFLFLLPSSAWASLSIEPSVQPDEDGSYSIVGNGSYIITTNGIETGTAIYLDSLVDEDPENHLIVTLQDFKTNSSFNVKGNVTIVLKGDRRAPRPRQLRGRRPGPPPTPRSSAPSGSERSPPLGAEAKGRRRA